FCKTCDQPDASLSRRPPNTSIVRTVQMRVLSGKRTLANATVAIKGDLAVLRQQAMHASESRDAIGKIRLPERNPAMATWSLRFSWRFPSRRCQNDLATKRRLRDIEQISINHRS